MTVHIDIGEIILNGVEVPDVAAFRAALMLELTGLAADHHGEIAGGTEHELHGSPVYLSTSERLAGQVARSTWHSIVPKAMPLLPHHAPEAGHDRA